jgi:hypothetical protein
MKYNFVTDLDIDAAIKDIYREQIAPDEYQIKIAEKSAIEKMKGVLNQRYLVEDIFPIIEEWEAGKSYYVPEPINGTDFFGNNISYTPTYKRIGFSLIVRNYTYYNDKYYRAITNIDGTGTTQLDNPEDNPSLWIEEDPRNAFIIMNVVHLLIFNICVRIAPKRIPENRKFFYDEVNSWLREVRDNLITPDLPKKRPIDDSSDSVPFGSEGKVEGGWHY